MRQFLSPALAAMLLGGLAMAAALVSPAAAAGLRVVATTEDLASLAREVGGDKITVTALAAPTSISVTVDVNADRHAFSPWIYGVNFGDAANARVGRQLGRPWTRQMDDVERGLARARHFSWAESVARTLAIYREVAGR